MCVRCLDAFQAHHTERTHARTKAREPKNTKTQHAAATAAKQRAKLSRPSTVRVCVRSLYGLSYAASGWTAYNPRKRSHTHARELSALNVTAGQGDGGRGLSRAQQTAELSSSCVRRRACGQLWQMVGGRHACVVSLYHRSEYDFNNLAIGRGANPISRRV